MAKKQFDESKVCGCCKGPFYVVDEGKEGGWHGVWFKHADGEWSRVCSGMEKGTAEAVAGALSEKPMFGKLNKHAKKITFIGPKTI